MEDLDQVFYVFIAYAEIETHQYTLTKCPLTELNLQVCGQRLNCQSKLVCPTNKELKLLLSVMELSPQNTCLMFGGNFCLLAVLYFYN